MNLEADQAVQEARFAGACQDQHAGRPAPNLGWPGEKKSIVHKPKQVSFLETKPMKVTGPGARVAQGLGPGPGGKRARDTPPTPSPAFLGSSAD